MNENATRIRMVKSKCMADMLVWLGFEYKKTDEGHIFQRSSNGVVVEMKKLVIIIQLKMD